MSLFTKSQKQKWKHNVTFHDEYLQSLFSRVKQRKSMPAEPTREQPLATSEEQPTRQPQPEPEPEFEEEEDYDYDEYEDDGPKADLTFIHDFIVQHPEVREFQAMVLVPRIKARQLQRRWDELKEAKPFTDENHEFWYMFIFLAFTSEFDNIPEGLKKRKITGFIEEVKTRYPYVKA